MQDFRKLRVWRKAHILALRVRPATRTFPKTGYSALKSQMTTAAESIAFNIVEGCGTDSQKEFARFLEISIKSSSELEYQLQLATDYGVLPPPQSTKLTKRTVDVRKMLCGLRKKVLGEDDDFVEEDDDSD